MGDVRGQMRKSESRHIITNVINFFFIISKRFICRNWKIWANWTTRISCTHPTMATIWVNSDWLRARVFRLNSMCGCHFWYAVLALSQRLCKFPVVARIATHPICLIGKVKSDVWPIFHSFFFLQGGRNCVEYRFGSHIPGYGRSADATADGW